MSASVWKKVKLISRVDINRGGSPRPIDAFITESIDGINWIKIGDVEKGAKYIEKTKEKIISEGEFHSRKVVKGDFLLSNSMSFGRPYILHVDGCIHDGWLAIQNYHVTFDTEFLYYLLSSDDIQRQYKSLAAGSTVLNLNKDIVSDVVVIFPVDLKEQKHISDILSSCDSVIQNTQKVIDKYKAIKQGMMHDLFTRGLTKDGKLRPSYQEAPELYKPSELGMIPKEWEKDCIGNNYITYAGGTPSREHDEYYKGDIPWVTSSECNQLEINDTLEHITNIAVQRTSTKMVKAGAILLALYGATAGQVAKLNLDATTNQAVLACLSDNKNDNIYLLYYFGYIKDKMLYLAQGSGQPNLSKTSVDKFVYLKPDKSEQIAIAKRLSSIDSAIQKEDAMLAKYKNIKTGLMARLLTPPQDAQIIDETEE